MAFSARVEPLLDAEELELSLDFLASLQLKSGMVPWFSGGRADPWNHTEAMIAFALGGRLEEAMAGLNWLFRSQNADGTWCHFYLSNGVAEPRRDSNTCCYPVLLVSILDRIVGDKKRLEPFVEMALRAIDKVVDYQRADGSIPWAIDPSGDPYPTSLIAASSSVCDSLAIAVELCSRFGKGDADRYIDAGDMLKQSVVDQCGPYSDTSEWAMDHYYPHMGGIADQASLAEEFLERFYLPRWGIRCIASKQWFTAAETAEAAMALHLQGESELAEEIFLTLGRFRCDNGAYLTGVVGPIGQSFPHSEQSSYSVAAVILASFAIAAKARSSIGMTLLRLFS